MDVAKEELSWCQLAQSCSLNIAVATVPQLCAGVVGHLSCAQYLTGGRKIAATWICYGNGFWWLR